MSRYRKVDPRIWNDAKFRELSDKGKLVFLFLMTHPHMTALGAMRATVSGLSEELHLEGLPEAFREAFREALSKGMVKHDPKACFLWLPNFLKYNGPESPNVVKAWASAADLLPECAMKFDVIQRAKAFTEGLPEAFAEAFRKAFAEALAKPLPNQEQEQEQELIPPNPPLLLESQQPTRLNGKHKRQRQRLPATACPEEFDVTEAMSQWAVTQGLSSDAVIPQTERFLDHWRGKGEMRADWQATWRTWIRNAVEFSKR